MNIASVESRKEVSKYEIYKHILPNDLLRFGLIPEFVGRLPIIATLKELDREELKQVVTKPKNALIKQYKKLVELDNVKLEFEEEALDLIVDKAIERNTGARGLRSIIEEIMRDIMYDIPSNPHIAECIITKAAVENTAEAKIVNREENDNDKKVKKIKTA